MEDRNLLLRCRVKERTTNKVLVDRIDEHDNSENDGMFVAQVLAIGDNPFGAITFAYQLYPDGSFFCHIGDALTIISESKLVFDDSGDITYVKGQSEFEYRVSRVFPEQGEKVTKLFADQ